MNIPYVSLAADDEQLINDIVFLRFTQCRLLVTGLDSRIIRREINLISNLSWKSKIFDLVIMS